MRAIPFDQSIAKKLARLVTITAGVRVIRFTDQATSYVIDGNTWFAQKAVQFQPIEFPTNGDVSNGQFQIATGNGQLIATGEAVAGAFTNATATVEWIDAERPDDGRFTLLSGVISGVSENFHRRIATFEVRGKLARAKGIDEKRLMPNCIHRFGDDNCRVAVLPPDQTRDKDYVEKEDAITVASYATRVRTLSGGGPGDYENVVYECTTAGTTHASVQPTYDPTVGNTTTDGTAVFTARNAWARAAVIDTVTDEFNFILTALPDVRAVDGWFKKGKALIRTGQNAGKVIPISNWFHDELQVVTNGFSVFGLLTPGDEIEIVKGCQLTEADCQFFDNIINNGAWSKFCPGRNLAMSVA